MDSSLDKPLTDSQSITPQPGLPPDSSPVSSSSSQNLDAPSQSENKKTHEQALEKLVIGKDFTIKSVEANALTSKWHKSRHRIAKFAALFLLTPVPGLISVAALVSAVALTTLGAAVTVAVGAVGMGIALPGIILTTPYAAYKIYKNYQENKILKPFVFSSEGLKEIQKPSDQWDLEKLSSSSRNLETIDDKNVEVSNHLMSLSRAYRRYLDMLPKSPEYEQAYDVSQEEKSGLNEKELLVNTKESLVAIETKYFTKIQKKLKTIDKLLWENKSVDKLLKSIEKDYENCLKEICNEKECSIDLKLFKEVCALERGRGVKKMSNVFKIGDVLYIETATPLNTSAGLDYLKLKTQGKPNKTLEPCIEYLKTAQGIRPSSLKKQVALQATTINLFEHTLFHGTKSSNKETIDSNKKYGFSSVLRSGAFAVHDRQKTRIAELKHELAKERAVLSRCERNLVSLKNGLTSKASLDQAEKTVDESKAKIKSIKEEIKAAQKGPKNIGLHELKKRLSEIEEDYRSIIAMSNTQISDKATKALGKKIVALGFTSIKEIRQEIDTRQSLVVAQALPKIVHSVQRMVEDPDALTIAQKTGSFLHVEESFLSHLDASEKAMIEDMKGAMDYLRDNCVIKLDSTMKEGAEPKIELDPNDPQKVIIRLRNPSDSKKLSSKESKIAKENERTTFGLSALMFTTGVNENQTFGHIYGKYDQLQAEINADGLNHLEAYANAAKKDSLVRMEEVSHAQDAVKAHYSEATTRAAKDMQGVERRRALVKTLHGGKGVVCKSGKDRTAGETCRDLASDGARHDGVNEVELRNKLLESISHKITGVNIGKNGYCFNKFQRLFIPENMCPRARLCGGNES